MAGSNSPLGLSFRGGWLLALGTCLWLYIIPTITAIAGAFLTANQGLNNAAQKPLVHPAGSDDSHGSSF
jgi:hypothetical protein